MAEASQCPLGSSRAGDRRKKAGLGPISAAKLDAYIILYIIYTYIFAYTQYVLCTLCMSIYVFRYVYVYIIRIGMYIYKYVYILDACIQ